MSEAVVLLETERTRLVYSTSFSGLIMTELKEVDAMNNNYWRDTAPIDWVMPLIKDLVKEHTDG